VYGEEDEVTGMATPGDPGAVGDVELSVHGVIESRSGRGHTPARTAIVTAGRKRVSRHA
jgi:hypothetical protein